jgi:hypothetical protein
VLELHQYPTQNQSRGTATAKGHSDNQDTSEELPQEVKPQVGHDLAVTVVEQA